MPPVFITVLAVVIVVSLVLVAVDQATKPARRRKVAAQARAQRAIENQPIPGMNQVALDEGCPSRRRNRRAPKGSQAT